MIAGITTILIAPVRLLRGEQTTSATLREVSAGVSWSGTAVYNNATFNPAACQKSGTCDTFTLKIEVSDEYRTLHPEFAALIRLGWDDSKSDFDL